jgi:hypothetical protein
METHQMKAHAREDQMRQTKVFRNADGTVSTTLHGELVKISAADIPGALATLLDHITWLEERVEHLEKNQNG